MAQGAERIKMLADNYIPVRQLGNGNTTGFSFDFDMMSEAYVRVYRETDGVQELVPADEYTAELDGSAGGVIVFDTAPASGTYIVIAREVPLTQETPYKTSSGFSAVRTEQDFDKQTAISQQLSDEIGRSIKMQVGTTGIDLTLPSASPGKAIVWNQSGNALKNSTINVDDVIDEVTKIKDEAASSAQDAADSAVSSGKSRDESAAWAKSAAETVDGFDLHAAEKTTAFDENATQKTNDFNANAAAKQAAVDSSAAAAAASAEEAESWATGTIETRPEGSAEYWAGVAKGQTLPEQSGHAGKWLGTDGTVAGWKDVAVPVSAVPVNPAAGTLYWVPEV